VTTRRRLTVAALLCVALTTALGCGALAQQKTFADVTIIVGTHGGPWVDRIVAGLGDEMKAAGITLKFVAGTSSDFLAKMIAARGQAPPFDVIEIADETYDDFRKANFLAKLDRANIPNLAAVDASMYDDYRVANWASEPGIIYNVDKLKAAGIQPPQRFSDLADPALAGRVLLADVGNYMGYYQVIGLAYENGGSEKNLQPGFDMMAKIRPHSYATSAATQMQLFAAGDIWASAAAAHLAIRLFDAGVNVATVHPTIAGHKGALAHGYLAVSRDSKNQAAAEAYINAMTSSRMQEMLYLDAATIPINEETMRKVLGDARVDKSGTPFLQIEPKTVAQEWTPVFADVDKRDFARRWQRAVAAQSE
jgi:putative spermidine/putrescine transport system substrate-binding protein